MAGPTQCGLGDMAPGATDADALFGMDSFRVDSACSQGSSREDLTLERTATQPAPSCRGLVTSAVVPILCTCRPLSDSPALPSETDMFSGGELGDLIYIYKIPEYGSFLASRVPCRDPSDRWRRLYNRVQRCPCCIARMPKPKSTSARVSMTPWRSYRTKQERCRAAPHQKNLQHRSPTSRKGPARWKSPDSPPCGKCAKLHGPSQRALLPPIIKTRHC